MRNVLLLMVLMFGFASSASAVPMDTKTMLTQGGWVAQPAYNNYQSIDDCDASIGGGTCGIHPSLIGMSGVNPYYSLNKNPYLNLYFTTQQEAIAHRLPASCIYSGQKRVMVAFKFSPNTTASTIAASDQEQAFMAMTATTGQYVGEGFGVIKDSRPQDTLMAYINELKGKMRSLGMYKNSFELYATTVTLQTCP